MNPQSPYGADQQPQWPVPAAPQPPSKDRVRTGLLVALGALLTAAVVLVALLIWPQEDPPVTGTEAGPSVAAGSDTPSATGGDLAGSDAFTDAPAPTAATQTATTTTKTATPSAPAGPATTNGVTELQRADACYLATSGQPARVSTDPEWGISEGPEVLALTTLLAYLGYGATPSGSYGPGAEQAAMAFQGDHGLVVDGIVGPQTWPVLNQVACG